MFDKDTQEALEKLDEEDLFKLSRMIQKLARKKPSGKRKKQDSFINPTRAQKKEAKSETEQENLFLKMPERLGHKEDSEIDKALAVHPPTPRSRSANVVEAKCMACGKTTEVSGDIVPQEMKRYICNNCQVRGAKRN
jgi:hypothetical protein